MDGFERLSRDKDRKCKLIDFLNIFEPDWLVIEELTLEDIEQMPYTGLINLADQIIGDQKVPQDLQDKCGVDFS